MQKIMQRQKVPIAYEVYCQIGGYPAVVTEYLEIKSLQRCREKLVVHEYDSNISKAVCNQAISWLQSAGILDFAGKITECRILDFKARSRCFFTDIGPTGYFLRKAGADRAAVNGLLQENFVFLELRRRVERLNEMALGTPAFATYKDGEIDFYVKSLIGNEKSYAVEVKSGKNQAATGRKALGGGKVDYLLMLKGNTQGGIAGKQVQKGVGASKAPRLYWNNRETLS